MPVIRRRWFVWMLLAAGAALAAHSFVDLTSSAPPLYVLERHLQPEQHVGTALATDTGRHRILTADYGGLEVFDMNGGEPLAALSERGRDEVTGMSQIWGVTFDEWNDRILVADTGRDRVMVFDPETLAPRATITMSGYVKGESRPVTSPISIAVDPKRGHLIITNLMGGIFVIDWRSFAPVATIDPFSWPAPGDTADEKRRAPRGVAVDTVNDHIVVVDYTTHSVHVLDAATFAHVATIGGIGTNPDQLRGPWFVAINQDLGHILVSDMGNRCIKVFDAKTFAYIGKIKEDFFIADGMSFSDGKLYVSAVRPEATGSSLMVFKPVVAEPTSK
jgi:DNA-binding beta-propeller fold protein YncE